MGLPMSNGCGVANRRRLVEDESTQHSWTDTRAGEGNFMGSAPAAGRGMSLRILVTGSSGFIGSAMTATLANGGHHVRAASRTRTAIADTLGVEWVELPDLEGAVDWTSLLDGIDVVIHL